jgi:cytosine/creatinine deaminase
MDPWYPLGTANSLQVAHVGTHAAQLLSRDEIEEAFRMVTSRPAAVLGLGSEEYGVHEGGLASFVLLPASDGYDAVRRQVRPTHVVSHGRVIATTPPPVTTLTLPGEDPTEVTFTPTTEDA